MEEGVRVSSQMADEQVPADLAYEPPTVTVLGTVSELTLAGAAGPINDGMFPSAISDRRLKRDWQTVDGAWVLDVLSSLELDA